MKNLLLLLMLAFSANVLPLDYTISFTGSGASTIVESVIVQNITNGTSIIVPAGNTLNLVSTTDVENVYSENENLIIFTDATNSKTTVQFKAKQASQTKISVYSIDGRKIIDANHNLPQGTNTFELSLPNGLFVIEVCGSNFKYARKINISTTNNSNPTLSLVGTTNEESTNPKKTKSEISGVTQMVYAVGDRLLYKGISNIYATIVTDVPAGDKTTNFNFVKCQDTDGNNYAVVTIGTQTWMAENLRTTKYSSGGSSIPNVTSRQDWLLLTTGAYCTYNNTTVTDSITKYGLLYNWYATTIENHNLAPVGWHVPSNAEWTKLSTYVAANVGTSLNAAKALASTMYWNSSTNVGAIGNNPSLNNFTGFSALPSGGRFGPSLFENLGSTCNFWAGSLSYSTNSYCWTLSYGVGGVSGLNTTDKPSGKSVRCVMD